MKRKPKRGVYFLANDRVIEPTIAFLKSFRFYNPTIDLQLIPFDQNFNEIFEVRDVFNFSIFADNKVLSQCDEISKAFHDGSLGAYRKLAIWEGSFDEFIYIDIDTIVLSNIDFAFEHLNHTSIFTSHSNIEAIRRWVWKDPIFELNCRLNKKQIGYAANTGFITSKKGVLSIGAAVSKMDAALMLKGCMELHCMEQPFLNYLIVTSGVKYGSLSAFLERRFLRKKYRESIKLEMWAGESGGVTSGGKLITSSDHEIFLIHWAGKWLGADYKDFDNMPYSELWKYYRYL